LGAPATGSLALAAAARTACQPASSSQSHQQQPGSQQDCHHGLVQHQPFLQLLPVQPGARVQSGRAFDGRKACASSRDGQRLKENLSGYGQHGSLGRKKGFRHLKKRLFVCLSVCLFV